MATKQLAFCLALLFCGALRGSDSTGAPPAWYSPPQLFVMTGFIANSTSGTWGAEFLTSGDWTRDKQQAALREWNKGLGRNYDADSTVRAFKEAGATGVIFYDKWHDGIVPHDTKLTAWKTERDLVGETVKALRKHGLKIVIYYSVGFDYNPEPRFLEWACRDSAGQPMGRCFPTDFMSFHSPYRKYVIDHLVEILRQYGPLDGLWLDIFSQPVISYDRYTRQAFEARYKKRLEQSTPAEQSDFVVETRRTFLQEIKRATRAVQPEVTLTFNGAGMADNESPKSADQVDRLADWFSMEGHRWPNIDRGARVGHSMDRPFEVGMLFNSSWYVPMTDQAPPPSMSEEEAVVSAATAWIQGANIYGAMTPGHSGVFDGQGDLALLRATGKWLKDNRSWLEGAQAYADVGIVRGTPSAELRAPASVRDLWLPSLKRIAATGSSRPGDNLDFPIRQLGYFCEFVGSGFSRRPGNLESFRMVALPENAPLDEKMAGQVREYVRNGGKLLACGHASLFDELGKQRANFALSDVFGVQRKGYLPGYKQLAIEPGSGLTAAMRLNPGALEVEATSGKVLARWRSAGNAPAIVENQFGKGRAIYVSSDETALAESSSLLEELAGRLVGAPPVAVLGSREYALVMNRAGRDLMLYLLNRNTGSRSNRDPEPNARVGTALGLEQVKVTIDTTVLGRIAKAETVPSRQPIEVSQRAGSAQIVVAASPSVTTIRLTQ